MRTTTVTAKGFHRRGEKSMLVSFAGYFIMVSLIPLLLLGGIAGLIASNAVAEYHKSATTSILRSHEDTILGVVSQAENLISAIIGNDAIIEGLKAPESADAYVTLATQAKIGYVLSNFLSIKGLSLIHLWVPGGPDFRVGSTLYSESIDETIQDRIFSAVVDSGKSLVWLGIQENMTGRGRGYVVDVARLLTTTDRKTLDTAPFAMLMLSFDPSSFYSILEQSAESTGDTFILLDASGKVIAHTGGIKAGEKLDPALERLIRDTDAGNQYLGSTKPQRVYSKLIERTGWRLAILIPESRMFSKTQRIYVVAFGVALGMIIGSTLITLSVARRWVMPLKHLAEAFHHLGIRRSSEAKAREAATSSAHPTPGGTQDGSAGSSSAEEPKRGDSTFAPRIDPDIDISRILPPATTSPQEVRDLVQWFNAFIETERERERIDRALRESEARLRYEAEYDYLTGLHNSRWLNTTLTTLLTDQQHGGMAHSALIFLDLDHFKLINDAQGHKVGDQVLIIVAQRLRESVGSRGDLVRLGGDEFIVLIRDNADRIESAIVDEIECALHAPVYVDGIRFALSASIGIALCERNYAKPDELLRDADIAMYRAKAAGRSRREFFDQSMSDKNITSLGSGSCSEQADTGE